MDFERLKPKHVVQKWGWGFVIFGILNQLAALVEESKPKALTSADIKEPIDKLLSSSGKSPAEKLEELSNLRYQRLLNDQEFELAKGKILGI